MVCPHVWPVYKQLLNNQVMRLLQEHLAAGELGIASDCVRVHHRRGYYSRDRQTNIVVDVSIEVTRPGARDPWLVCVWECKDYESRVPVDDIEEFHAKLLQIGVHRIKGTVASRGGFQRGAVTFARSQGIGLARILPDESLVHLVEGVHSDEWRAEHDLTANDPALVTSELAGLTSQGRGVIFLSNLVERELKQTAT